MSVGGRPHVSQAGGLSAHTLVLTDGGIETAIVYGARYPLPELQTAGMLDEPDGREVLHDLWRSYLDVAVRHDLPIVIGTPTWRAGPDRVAAAGRPAADVERLNRQGVEHQRSLLEEVGLAESAWVAGVLGPRGDGYDPTSAPSAAVAAEYHWVQAAALADHGADLLFAVPLASAEEALGVCHAMAATDTPYVPSLLIDASGRLPDGSALTELVSRIDKEVAPAPAHFSISCVHPDAVVAAHASTGSDAAAWGRVRELKANGSSLPPARLDSLTELVCDPPAAWADAMARARSAVGLTILGGCCGTDASHLEALADRLVPGATPSM